MKTEISKYGVKISFLILGLQNLLLGAGMFLSDRNEDISNQIEGVMKFAFYLDVLGFLALFLIGGYILLTRDKISSRNWGFIVLGSILFIYGSLVWRTALDLYPAEFLEFFSAGILVSGNPEGSFNEIISFIIRALQVSNFGLLLTSVGIYFEDSGKSRYLILMYGIINMLCVLVLTIFLFIKIITVYLAFPYFLYKVFRMTFPEMIRNYLILKINHVLI